MALTPGTRLGPYAITAQIGVGGMGEVYRARDTKLDRDVAIKMLPASLASDPERIARFQREAKTLASLNHPNIAQIHGLEESEGIVDWHSDSKRRPPCARLRDARKRRSSRGNPEASASRASTPVVVPIHHDLASRPSADSGRRVPRSPR